MQSLLVVSSVLVWVVVIINILLTIALVRQFNRVLGQIVPFLGMGMGEKLTVGEAAPDFKAETLTGESVTLAHYARKAVSFVFISPHCDPCVEKIPTLTALSNQAKQAGVEIVLVNTEGSTSETATFVKQHGITLPVLVAPRERNSFANDYKALMTPSYCLIDQDSHVKETGMFTPGWEDKLAHAWSNASSPQEQRVIVSTT
ncbi:MAG: TlpA disulfide reductase family protein [Chloroflexota bacterium]